MTCPDVWGHLRVLDGTAADRRDALLALRRILGFHAVATVIPGSTSPEHIRSNVAASNARPLTHEAHGATRDVYEKYVEEHVHHRW